MLYPINRPAEPPRVVITGAGIVSALGIGWKSNAGGFRVGRTTARPVTLFDVSRQKVKLAAEVDLPQSIPMGQLTTRQAARLDRGAKLLLLAAHEAWEQSGWQSAEDLPFVLGTTAGGMNLGEDYYRQAVETPSHHGRQPTRALHYQAQTQARAVSEALGFTGPVRIVSNACASGSDAVGLAWQMISGRPRVDWRNRRQSDCRVSVRPAPIQSCNRISRADTPGRATGFHRSRARLDDHLPIRSDRSGTLLWRQDSGATPTVFPTAIDATAGPCIMANAGWVLL